jgi:hypothetical protein
MDLSTALNMIDTHGRLFDIGQFSPEVIRGLKKNEKMGIIKKQIAFWPWVLCGTCKKKRWTRGSK